MFSRVGPEGSQHIYRISADGSGLTYVRPGYSPQFSREGKKIAFSSSEGISVAARDGSNPRPILEHDSIGYTPHDWSPINDLVAWEGHNNVSWIGAISPQRATWTPGFRLDPTEEFDVNRPQWSPDGTRLAMGITFSVESGCWQSSACIPHRDVGLTVSDLAGERTVLHPNGHDPAWSPDGTRLAFVVPALDFRADPPKIHVVGADGDGDRALTVGGEPDWQPLPVRPREPETRTVTVTVPAPPPPPVVVERVVTRTVRVPAERCEIAEDGRRLTLTIRTRTTISRGARIRIALLLDGERVTASPGRGIEVRARWALDRRG